MLRARLVGPLWKHSPDGGLCELRSELHSRADSESEVHILLATRTRPYCAPFASTTTTRFLPISTQFQEILAARSNEEEGNDGQEETMSADPKTPLPALTSAFAQHGTVTLLVAFDGEPLVAHESYLTKNSEFFQAAMKKEWAEGQTRVIKLPEEDVAIMTSYLTAIYGCQLPTSTMTAAPSGGFEANQWQLLVELYLVGERMLDKHIQNAVIKEILRISKLSDKRGGVHFMPTSVVNMCFDATTEQSPLRWLIIDECFFWHSITRPPVTGERISESYAKDQLDAYYEHAQKGIDRRAFTFWRNKNYPQAEDYFV
jgi:hypothetical protein